MNDAVAALDGSMTFDEKTRSYEVKLNGHTAVFGVDAALAVVDTKLVPLGAPVRGQGALAWAEPEFFQKVIGPMAGLSLVWDRATRTLSVRRERSPRSRSSRRSPISARRRRLSFASRRRRPMP